MRSIWLRGVEKRVAVVALLVIIGFKILRHLTLTRLKFTLPTGVC